MEGYRARRDGTEISVASLQELFGMVSRGELRRTDEVWTPSGWVKAADLPELRAEPGADPWDAWSDSDLADADAVYQGYVKSAKPPSAPVFGAAPTRAAPTPGPFPHGAPPPASSPATAGPSAAPPPLISAPQPRPGSGVSVTPRRSPDDELDPVSVPVEPASAPVLPPPRPSMPPGVLSMNRGPGSPRTSRPSFPPPDGDEPTDPGRAAGQLIALPRPPPRKRPEVAVIRERPSRPVPLVRLSRLFLWVALGVLGLGTWFLWVRAAGTYVPTDPKVAGGEEPVAPTPPEEPVVEEGPTLADTERELRAGLTTEVRPIDAEGELGDALLIDLQNLRADVIAVDAPVTVWSGRNRDVPKVAEVHVRLSSDRDLPRQFGAIALAVGRYKRSLRLDIPVLEVIVPGPDGPLSTTLDPKAAEDFYLARITLETLLTSRRGG